MIKMSPTPFGLFTQSPRGEDQNKVKLEDFEKHQSSCVCLCTIMAVSAQR